MKLIVGLGNPEVKYFRTRHNAGRLVVEHIAGSLSKTFQKKKSLKASLVSLEWDGVPVTLAYPETYMNSSGGAVNSLVRHWKLDFKRDFLVVVDDTALPFGKFRLRGRGSDGGHQGLRSVQEALGSLQYARLRFGIGSPSGKEGAVSLERYVLAPFPAREEETLPVILEQGLEACRRWATQSLERAMHAVNSSKS